MLVNTSQSSLLYISHNCTKKLFAPEILCCQWVWISMLYKVSQKTYIKLYISIAFFYFWLEKLLIHINHNIWNKLVSWQTLLIPLNISWILSNLIQILLIVGFMLLVNLQTHAIWSEKEKSIFGYKAVTSWIICYVVMS